MDEYTNTFDETQFAPVSQLSAIQRRVLGTLIEKAMTTPDQYPMTIKGATTGCNQKSNRDPAVNYREDDVFRVLEELRELGLVAVVLTGGGRTERYRHYIRKRFPFSEPQIAIMTELWLRGRQQLGELRTRASRMVPIESLEALRTELDGLLAAGYIQANGSLDRRGIEVDHNFYRESEGKFMEQGADDEAPDNVPVRPTPVPVASRPATSSPVVEDPGLRSELMQLKQQQAELQDDVATMREQLSELMTAVQLLKRDLGV